LSVRRFVCNLAWEVDLVTAPRRKRGEVGSKPTPGTSLPIRVLICILLDRGHDDHDRRESLRTQRQAARMLENNLR